MNPQITELARKFKELKHEYGDLEERLKKVNDIWTQTEAALLEAMAEEGVRSVSIEGVGTVTLRTKNYLSVNAANKERFYSYLQEAGHGGLLKLDVNSRTLTAFLKQHHEELTQNLVQGEGLEFIEAREKALEFLNSKGANFFTKRDIGLSE